MPYSTNLMTAKDAPSAKPTWTSPLASASCPLLAALTAITTNHELLSKITVYARPNSGITLPWAAWNASWWSARYQP